MKIKTVIALGILAASQFINVPVRAKNFLYPPCRTVDIFFKKELRKNGVNPISISMDDASKNYQNYPKPGKQFSSTEILTAIVKISDGNIVQNIKLQKEIFKKVYKSCDSVAAINLGVQQSGNDSTVGVPITGTQPIQFQCIEERGTSKKLQWGTKYCD